MAKIEEILCEAIDTIVEKRIQDLHYDITKLCTIIDDSEKLYGKYIVSDGAIRLEAYSIGAEYKIGDSVLVNIPNGDYNMQKTIIAEQAEAKTTPFNYVSPLSSMIKLKVSDEFAQSAPESSLLANDKDQVTFSKIYESNNTSGLRFTRLGISADFKAWFGNDIIQSGTYGLKVYLYPVLEESGVYELNFNSQDMFGNPYNFESYFTQEKVFDISEIPEFKKISVYFYQGNNFIDELGQKIPYKYSMDGLEQKCPDNLFISNLEVAYGFDSSEFTDDKIILLNSKDEFYDLTASDADNEKTLSINWIHKIDSNNYELIEEIDGIKYKLDWFVYDGKILDSSYAGIGWKQLQDGEAEGEKFQNQLLIKYIPNKEIQENKIKAVATFKDIASEDIISTRGQRYQSNIITLQNRTEIPSSATLQAASALEIFFNDGSNGNYFLYDQNGKIMNESEGPSRIRTLSARYKGQPIDESIGNIESLTWYIPYPNYEQNNEAMKTSMIKPIINQTPIEDSQIYFQGLWYRVYTFKPNDGKFADLQYAIYDILTPMKVNNTIRCVLKMNGIEYDVNKELMFSKMGTNGSNFNFMLNFASDNAINLDPEADQNELRVDALLFNSTTGEPLEIDNDKLSWEWESHNDNALIINSPSEIDATWRTLSYQGEFNIDKGYIDIDNYNILKATYNYNENIRLEAYLPIPFKTSQNYVFIEGARQIEYNHQGNPYYYKDPYKIFDNNYDSVTNNIGWELKYDGNIVDYVNIADSYYAADVLVNEEIKKYLPSFAVGQIGGITYGSMRAPLLYLAEYDKNICVNCVLTNSDKEPQKILWSQPILITQSSYDFSMLNNWDGSLQIDDGNNTIMAAMLGAGRKNEYDNTFSGVLIGDIKEGTEKDDTETLTGVYGIHHGILSYGLKEDGTAFLGRKGYGQILFDGESGTIKSSEWEGGTGLLLDIDQGSIDSCGNDGQRFYLNPQKENGAGNDFDLKIWGKGGQDKTLLNITTNGDEEEYYIQSAGFTSDNGTKLDLAKGTFESYSDQGGLQLKSNPTDSESYFNVFAKTEDNGNINLIEMGNKGYYLQSIGYIQRNLPEKVGEYQVYQYLADQPFIYRYAYKSETVESQTYYILDEENLVKVNNGDYVGLSADFQIAKIKKSGSNYIIDSEMTFTGRQISTGTKITVGRNEVDTYNKVDGNKYDVKADIVKKEFISYLKEILQGEGYNGTGLKIDLDNGIIDGYGLYLKGQTENKGSFVLDSTALQSPFVIKDNTGKTNFSVDWDGTLTSTKVNSLNDDGRNDKAISINNNFYVDKNGNVGGGYASFGSGWFGGTANLAKNATHADSAGEAEWSKYLGPVKNGVNLAYAKARFDTIVPDPDGSLDQAYFRGIASAASALLVNNQKESGSDMEFKEITSTDGEKYTVLGKK